jgi:pyruvate, water dikinase
MMDASLLTLDFTDPRSCQVRLVGGKGAGLATMTQQSLPVAPGFTVSTATYRSYLEATGLDRRLAEQLEAAQGLPIDALDEQAQTIAAWFDYTELPPALFSAVQTRYTALCAEMGLADLSVAVRSSATAEDAAGTSFAGEYETYVGIRGADQVALHLRRCWASAFTARALSYAWKNSISPLQVDMAVVVQKTVAARAAGVMFTISPLSGDRSRIVVEASYGLGLGVVGGEVTPDCFVVAKIEMQVLERTVGDKHLEYLDGHTASPVEHDRRIVLCLNDDEVLALAKLGKRLERLHGAPQDIEFAIDRELPAGRDIVLLQCRPVTVLSAPAAAAAGPAAGAALSQLAANVLAAARRA